MQTILNAQVLETRMADAERRLTDPGRERRSTSRTARRRAAQVVLSPRRRRTAHAT
jgi:hypothetical protein